MILHGVDFSGADSGGAAKIRICERNLRAPKDPVVSRGRADRRGLLRQIEASLSDGRDHLWRIDAPLGLPLETLAAFDVPRDWTAMASWMADFGSPRGWRHDVREVDRKEPKRWCDRSERTPLAPMNLRVFKQTWTAICELALPLAKAGVRVEPVVNTASAGTVVLCESCPASVLERYGWPAKGYKGGGDPPARVREEIVGRLGKVGVIVPPAMATEAVRDTEGDLLDALLLLTPPTQTVVPADALVEAWVY